MLMGGILDFFSSSPFPPSLRAALMESQGERKVFFLIIDSDGRGGCRGETFPFPFVPLLFPDRFGDVSRRWPSLPFLFLFP